jgi:transcriptional regulator with XRE-family HTH domain
MLSSEEPFGQRLARFRKERGYTQVELAAKMGLTQALVTDYERSRLRMHAEMVIRFSQALDVSTDELLGVKATQAKDKAKVSLKIVRRLQRIERLPFAQQKTLLKSIDMLLNGAASHSSS